MTTFTPNRNSDVYYYKSHIKNYSGVNVNYNFDSLTNGRYIVK